MFEEAEYSFSVAEDAEVGRVVGTVEATEPDADTLTYSITEGNSDGRFSIDGSSGVITVAGSLDMETTPTYTLTVEAEVNDEKGARSTVTVEVRVLEGGS